MVEMMHNVLLEAIKATFVHVNFIVISANEVTTIDNTMVVNSFIHGARLEKDSNPPMC
jgi:hypothetical protein